MEALWRFGGLHHSFRRPHRPQRSCRPYVTAEAVDSIAEASLIDPPVSSITINFMDLFNAEADWVAVHIEHAEVPNGLADMKWVVVADDESDDDGQGKRLLECCGTSRPRKARTLTVTASSAAFVTSGEFVSTTHSWFHEIRDEILFAKGIYEKRSLPVDTPMYVLPFSLNWLTLDLETTTCRGSVDLWKSVADYVHRRHGGILD